MKPRNGALASLLFLATCTQADPTPTDSTNSISPRQALGKVPASEVATWKKVGASNSPDERYLQSAAFDETRKVLVMFGGLAVPYNASPTPRQELWEWSPTTGAWTDRTPTGTKPAVRSGAGMVFDSTRNKFVLFGGRAGSGYNYQDTWEWDPTTGAWTDRTTAGTVPSSRCQGTMVFEKSTGKVLLFGGGRSTNGDTSGLSMSLSFGDTWEWDATTGAWSQRTVTAGPAGRYDASMVWDSTRNLAVLFGGMEKDDATVDGIPKQDTWEWDPAAGTWTERTATGTKPSPRWGQAAAFDGSRGKVVVFGGWDINTGGYLDDLWDWDPTTAAWTQRLTGTEANLPSPRIYASLVSNDSAGRLELVAGMVNSTTYYGGYGTGGYFYGGSGGSVTVMPPLPPIIGPGGYYTNVASKEVWELEPVAPTFTNRSAALNSPGRLTDHAMAYCPDTGKVYLYGGLDDTYVVHDNLWEWDGTTWSEVTADVKPPARMDAGLAYDPARKSLILFGGQNTYSSYYASVYNDTWEWNSTTRKWTQLFPTTMPDARFGHGMVTDTVRNKILLFGGMTQNNSYYGYPYTGIYQDPLRNDVWEWDGTKSTWTNRTPPATSSSPTTREFPVLAYDEGRQKMFLFDGTSYTMYPGGTSSSAFWEWDPTSTGWVSHDSGDYLDYNTSVYVAYDSVRRREVFYTDAVSPIASTANGEAWELDAKGITWYVRNLATVPSSRFNAAVTFDKGRGVVVMYGGSTNGFSTDETWEYSVTNLGNGEGCSSASASLCASGNCVEGVCCGVASCTGVCQSCAVSGQEGTCVAAAAGTEIAGSCSNGQSCDGKGGCKTMNGTACTNASDCASGFCTDGVCCNTACNGQCVSCNQAGFAGRCSPYKAGTDPEKECGTNTGVCGATCDGVSACAYPAYGSSCGGCSVCDGMGTCFVSSYTPYCVGGTGGSIYPTGGSIYPVGGSGGSIYPTGGVRITGGSYVTGGSSYVTGGTTFVASGGATYVITGGATYVVGGLSNSGGFTYVTGGTGGGSGGIPAGGSGGTQTDTSASTGGATHLRNSGCGCSLGQPAPGLGTTLTLPLALGAIALFWRGRRRSRKQ